MTATRVPRSGFTTMAPRIRPGLPPGRLGPQGQVGLLAVGEVALVEQADLLEHLAGGRASACRAGARPAPTPRSRVAGARMPPKYGSTIGVAPSPKSAQASPARGPLPHGLEHPGQAVRAPARRRAGPARPSRRRPAAGWASTCRKPGVGAGPEPAVAGQLQELDAGGQALAHDGDARRARSRCRRRPPARRRGTSWARNRATVPTQRSGRFQWRMTTGSTPAILTVR